MVVVVVGRIMQIIHVYRRWRVFLRYSLSDVFSVSYSCLTTFRTWLNDFNELKQIKAAAATLIKICFVCMMT